MTTIPIDGEVEWYQCSLLLERAASLKQAMRFVKGRPAVDRIPYPTHTDAIASKGTDKCGAIVAHWLLHWFAEGG
jgi:hypothetical protein